MIRVNEEIELDESELKFRFVRASGPGGQNVNKVASAVQLRFDVRSSSLPADVRERLIKFAGQKMTADGVLVIEAKRYRTQQANRQDAVERLVALIRKAARRPKSRRRTKPTTASRERRLDDKKRRGTVKRLRKRVSDDD